MKKCKNQLLAALIASTMAMSMTACSGASAETTKPSETAVTEKATETESESETAEAKEMTLMMSKTTWKALMTIRSTLRTRTRWSRKTCSNR